MHCRCLYPRKGRSAERCGCLSVDEGQWPRGKSEADVVLSKGLFISQDIVAVDTAATSFFNQVRNMPKLETVGHLAKAQALKLGTMSIDKLNVKRIKCNC